MKIGQRHLKLSSHGERKNDDRFALAELSVSVCNSESLKHQHSAQR